MRDTAARPVVLMLPGQGAQYARMGAGLYGTDSGFTAALDRLFEAYATAGGDAERLRAVWLAADPADAPAGAIHESAYSQPLLFAVGYALGEALRAYGVVPHALLGHSVGEFAAAGLAGVFDVAAAGHLLASRGEALAAIGPGGMVAVAASARELAPYTGTEVVVGAVNGPRQSVLAGARGPLAEAASRLRKDGLVCRAVAGDLPFHSPAAAEGARVFREAFAGIELRLPSVLVQSTATGRPVGAEDALRPAFWADQIAAPVLFWPALDALLSTGDFTLVEAGPGQQLVGWAKRHRAVRSGASTTLPLLPPQPGPADRDRAVFDAAVAALSADGVAKAG
ncbi:acyltransferase domain-containing protein [Streptodolium elevatio]|uniref:Acyltransferase domain-containing protein n=1 Tax=Streptodolium elevatio TaxID=3157996 RepID=A0ABV3DPQ3_9ACTN